MSQKLKVLKENAVKAYEAADVNGKKLLQDLFPGELVPIKITERVKTFEDACQVLGYDAECRLPYETDTTDIDELASNAFTKLHIIAKALNEGWKPDWKDGNQYKYFPYFKATESGFGFSNTNCGHWNAITYVGSRLCFKTRELAEYAGKQFEDLYNQFFTI